MTVIDINGEYEFIDGTRLPKTSNHPVQQARIWLALPVNSWLYAPEFGHNLERFKRSKQSDSKINEFQKELRLYLDQFEPDVREILIDRNGISTELVISEEVLSGI